MLHSERQHHIVSLFANATRIGGFVEQPGRTLAGEILHLGSDPEAISARALFLDSDVAPEATEPFRAVASASSTAPKLGDV